MYSLESHSWSSMNMLYLVQSDETEKLILDSKEKIEFYRSKMQDLVSSCFCLSPPHPSLLFFFSVFFSLIPNCFANIWCMKIKYAHEVPSLKKRVVSDMAWCLFALYVVFGDTIMWWFECQSTRSGLNINKNLVLLVCFDDHLRSFIIGRCRVMTDVVRIDAFYGKIVSSMNVIH
jgi:hypothetical protein